MYDLRYYNPRLAGNIYRSTHRCGRPNCRCAVSKRDWHPAYYLDYKQWHRGRGWVRQREYVPKSQVKALRQRIRRAKERDRQRRQLLKHFKKEAPRLVKALQQNPSDPFALYAITVFLEQNPQPVNELQRALLVKNWVDLALALKSASRFQC